MKRYFTVTATLCVVAVSSIISIFTACSKNDPDSDQPTIYVAGNVSKASRNTATLWKNGKPFQLKYDDWITFAYSVHAPGNDVYVAGYAWDQGGSGRIKAILWKNGEPIVLTNPESQYGEAYSVFVSGNDVYVGGSETNEERYDAIIWKTERPS